MANVATILRLEIRRIARKEVRVETSALKKAVAAYRSEIAALKRRSRELERQVHQRVKSGVPSRSATPDDGSPPRGRYSAKSLASQRKRLGLSAQELGHLIGVSAQSIYNWEEGKARPLGRYLPAVFALKGLGKRAASAHLESLAANSEREAA